MIKLTFDGTKFRDDQGREVVNPEEIMEGLAIIKTDGKIDWPHGYEVEKRLEFKHGSPQHEVIAEYIKLLPPENKTDMKENYVVKSDAEQVEELHNAIMGKKDEKKPCCINSNVCQALDRCMQDPEPMKDEAKPEPTKERSEGFYFVKTNGDDEYEPAQYSNGHWYLLKSGCIWHDHELAGIDERKIVYESQPSPSEELTKEENHIEVLKEQLEQSYEEYRLLDKKLTASESRVKELEALTGEMSDLFETFIELGWIPKNTVGYNNVNTLVQKAKALKP